MPLPSEPAQDSNNAFFLGLAPFLRRSIAGQDLQPEGARLLALAQARPDDANLLMNLCLVLQCLGQREMGLMVQAQALALQRVYHLAARRQPVRCRLLMLMEPGDLAANTPLECLLEDSDVELIFYYLSPGEPLQAPLPEHDALLVSLSDSDANRVHLHRLTQQLANWPKPVINLPQNIPNVDRASASQLLQQLPGVLMPPTLRASRAQMLAVAAGDVQLSSLFADCDFPVILRPLGSQGGHDLAKITNPDEVTDYLSRVHDAEFFISRFIDYSHADGFFRKIRVALIDGQAWACHMAVSSHWMVHYVNAGMYEEAWKRAEELAFMTHFEAFKQRHLAALDGIARAIGLDYLCIDCAETIDGQLLVFEVDHAMVIHAMDTEAQFPYKQIHMFKVKNAFRELLLRRMARHPAANFAQPDLPPTPTGQP
jgi:glutathione synthase/RimK-type ligase-like ATP-grasp enzyme